MCKWAKVIITLPDDDDSKSLFECAQRLHQLREEQLYRMILATTPRENPEKSSGSGSR